MNGVCVSAGQVKREDNIKSTYVPGSMPPTPVFRPISKWRVLGAAALHAGSVNTILEGCAAKAKLGYVPDLSIHSLRRGMATSAYRVGADFRAINRQGCRRYDGTVQGYIEEASQFEENAAGSMLCARARATASKLLKIQEVT